MRPAPGCSVAGARVRFTKGGPPRELSGFSGGCVSKKALVTVGIILAALLLIGSSCASTYNQLVALEQQADQQWAQVENVYQRRLDLVPNLVETVKGAAAFEKETFTAVTEARSRAAQVTAKPPSEITNDPAAMEKFQQAQDSLSTALSRLLVTVERYPELRATQNFRDLQAQLEGTENRIAVERMRYNEAAMQYNAKLKSFPTNIIASLFGDRFKEKAYFRAAQGAEQPPKVQF
jgi:LemA protein